MRRTIEVPAAGVSEAFPFVGRTLFIEQASAYFGVDEVPLLSFNEAGDQLPALTRSRFGYHDGYFDQCQGQGDGRFNKIVVTGTPESAGDKLTLFTTKSYINQDFINFDALLTSLSVAGDTDSSRQASDAVQSFTEAAIADSEGNLPKRAYIWVVGGATRGINYAFGSNPSQGFMATDAYYWDNDIGNAAGSGDIINHRALEIIGIDWILAFNYIAAVATETPTLVITFEY